LYFPTGDVSGDFFNVFPIGEKAAGIFICDVMGHGVRSALITSMIRGLVEEHVQAVADPGELLTRVNRALAVILKQADTTMFATCFYVWLMSNARSCVSLTRGIRPPFTFSTVMELRTNFRATNAPVRPWEFFRPPVMSRQAVR
jgi:serine phosphatase RsbU (regulator of sigma subunit)